MIKKTFVVEIEYCDTSVENRHFELNEATIRCPLSNMLMGCKSVNAIQGDYSVKVTEIDNDLIK